MGERDGLRPAVDAELFEDVLDVCRDGLLADDELKCDFALVETLCQEAEDLFFTFRQDGRRDGSPGHKFVRRGVPSDPCEELVGIYRLGEVVVGADQETGGAIERLGAHAGDEKHGKVRADLLLELAADLEAADAWKHDVEKDERRALFLRHIDRHGCGPEGATTGRRF